MTAILNNFDLQTFRSTVTNVARPYLFYIQVPLPETITAEQRLFTYLAQSTKIPDRSVDVLTTH